MKKVITHTQTRIVYIVKSRTKKQQFNKACIRVDWLFPYTIFFTKQLKYGKHGMVYMETNWTTRKQKYEYVNKHDDNGNTHNEN